MIRSLMIMTLMFAAAVSAQEPPAGTMAFVANLDGNWDLFVWGGKWPQPVQLTKTTLDERAPAISPDGAHIAYATSDGGLWVADLPARTNKRIMLPTGQYGYPSWFADGTAIVYTGYTFHPPDEEADFFVYSFKEGRQKLFLLQTGPQDYPAVSPDGGSMAYMSSVATLVSGFGSTMLQQLWIVSLHNGESHELLGGSARNTQPSWSPDGKLLAFSSDRKGNPDIWMMTVDGSDAPVQLTTGSRSDTHPAWSPDGKEIAYVSSESGRHELMILDVKTHSSRTVRPFGRNQVDVRTPTWR